MNILLIDFSIKKFLNIYNYYIGDLVKSVH